MQQTHRSGPLKQKNKAHHTLGHKSNRQIKLKLGGKTSSVQSLCKKNKVVEWKHERKNRETVLKKQKRLISFNQKRRIGQLHNAPYIVTLLYFGEQPVETCEMILNLFKTFVEEDANAQYTQTGDIILTCSRFKTRFHFLKPNINDQFACMDAAKITDVLLCVYNANVEDQIDKLKQDANSVLNAIYHHCLPTCLHVVYGANQIATKKQCNLKKSYQKQIDSWFPDEKLHFLDTKQDALQLLNVISNCKKKKITYRERRCQLLAVSLEYVESEKDGEESLKVFGFVRNQNLDVNKFIHVPGVGDFELNYVETLDDPYKTIRSKQDVEMKGRSYFRNPQLCQKFEIQNEVDENLCMTDQELPTAEDIAKAEAEHLKEKRLVPKGTSEYQAAWLVDSDEDFDDEANSSDSDAENNVTNCEMDDESIGSDESNLSVDEDMQSVAATENYEHKYDERLDFDEEMNTLAKIREERMNEMFPDEIDTPLNVLAKLRFANYRGLASLHKTKWDPYENLPIEYAKIFQFENWKRSRKMAFEGAELADGPSPGEYVLVSIKKFKKEIYENYVKEKKPFLFFQLLKHEHKLTLVNAVVKKHPSFNLPIKSKERLIFHVGCRRYSSCPIFSVHSNAYNHKYEKFLRPDTQMVASFYAPITFTPCPVTVYKQIDTSGEQRLVATGSLLENDPNRIVLKRHILSGYPFKIHKTFCVIRYMFFNRDDILWFKPIELRTKYGRKGTIKEPLGTHGHMKCVFDRPIKSNDTVLLNLYKRIYPKWAYSPDISFFDIEHKMSCDQI